MLARTCRRYTDIPPKGEMKISLVLGILMSMTRIGLYLKPSKPFRLNNSCIYLRHLRHLRKELRPNSPAMPWA